MSIDQKKRASVPKFPCPTWSQVTARNQRWDLWQQSCGWSGQHCNQSEKRRCPVGPSQTAATNWASTAVLWWRLRCWTSGAQTGATPSVWGHGTSLKMDEHTVKLCETVVMAGMWSSEISTELPITDFVAPQSRRSTQTLKDLKCRNPPGDGHPLNWPISSDLDVVNFHPVQLMRAVH